jgi:Glycosyl transferase family 2
MVVGEERERARRAVAAVVAQSIAGTLELVLVDLRPDLGAPTADVPGVSVTLVDRAGESSWSAARHAGVMAARATLVAFVEDHVYVEPGWAEAVVSAYRDHPDAVAVGYAFANARDDRKPDGTLFAEYGRWVEPARGGRWSALPGNNVSYRRDALLDAAHGAEDAFAIDFTLHAELARRGSFVVAPGAVVLHDGFPRLVDTLRANHEYGRALAAARAARGAWTPMRRVAYAAGTPLIPFLNAVRLARTLPGRGHWRGALRHTPTCLAIWAAAASGELVGYVSVSGAEGERLLRWEVDVERRPR